MRKFVKAIPRYMAPVDLFGAVLWFTVFVIAVAQQRDETLAWLIGAILLLRIGSLEARLWPIHEVFNSPKVTLTIHTEKDAE